MICSRLMGVSLCGRCWLESSRGVRVSISWIGVCGGGGTTLRFAPGLFGHFLVQVFCSASLAKQRPVSPGVYNPLGRTASPPAMGISDQPGVFFC